MHRLLHLIAALIEAGLALFILSQHGLKCGLRLGHLSPGLFHRLAPHLDLRAGLVHLVDGDELLRKQRLDPTQIPGGIGKVGLCAGKAGLSVPDRRLGFVDGGFRSLQVCFRVS